MRRSSASTVDRRADGAYGYAFAVSLFVVAIADTVPVTVAITKTVVLAVPRTLVIVGFAGAAG